MQFRNLTNSIMKKFGVALGTQEIKVNQMPIGRLAVPWLLQK